MSRVKRGVTAHADTKKLKQKLKDIMELEKMCIE